MKPARSPRFQSAALRASIAVTSACASVSGAGAAGGAGAAEGAAQAATAQSVRDHTPRTGASVDPGEDRKSTRLNSSHGYISYAVFCLKKKKKEKKRCKVIGRNRN